MIKSKNNKMPYFTVKRRFKYGEVVSVVISDEENSIEYERENRGYLSQTVRTKFKEPKNGTEIEKTTHERISITDFRYVKDYTRTLDSLTIVLLTQVNLERISDLTRINEGLYCHRGVYLEIETLTQ